MNNFEKELKANQEKHQKLAKYALFGALFLLVVSPWLFTRFHIFDWLVFSDKTGVIGDTIGGITAPFLNLAGAVLIYLSFSQQMEANKIQFNALKEDKADKKDTQNIALCDKLNSSINNKIDNFEFQTIKGIRGLKLLFKKTLITTVDPLKWSEVNELVTILRKHYVLLNQIQKISNEDFKLVYLDDYTIDYQDKIFLPKMKNYLSITPEDNISDRMKKRIVLNLNRNLKLYNTIYEDTKKKTQA